MSTTNETVVKRFSEEMCNGRHNEIAPEIFSRQHRFHDPQVPGSDGPGDMTEVVRPYQDSLDGHWEIDAMYSAGDTVIVRWRGSGKHLGEVNGIPATGRDVRDVRDVNAITIHRMSDGKIAETWEVWDTLGFLQQLGVVPES